MAQEAMQLSFGDGEYTFKLTLHGIKEIQEKCGHGGTEAGIGEVWQRLAASHGRHVGINRGFPDAAKFKVQDIIEPIRQGLIGGGSGVVDGEEVKVTAHVANRLIETYVINEPLQDSWALAYAIVGSLIDGYKAPEEKPKKKVASEPEEVEPTTEDTSTI